MYHRDQQHSGLCQESAITSATAPELKTIVDFPVPGPVLSVPAVVNGYVYVGVANSRRLPGSNGGSLLKISCDDGSLAAVFDWALQESYPPDPVHGEAQDSHGFTGMGCTPAVSGGYVYFSAFDGRVYCLDADTLALVWKTNLRRTERDVNGNLLHDQPVDNTMTDVSAAPAPPSVGWSSPVVANGNVYVGFGEGENPNAFGFVYCLDAASGDVVWLYCMCPYTPDVPNAPNVIPPGTWTGSGDPPAPFTIAPNLPPVRGASIWSSIAYDADYDRLYISTGNPNVDTVLPAPKYANSIVSLDATTGAFVASFHPGKETSYRSTDNDVDFGGSPTVYTLNDGTKVVAAGCKNGSIFVLNADTLELLAWRQMLPYDLTDPKNPQPFPNVDLHDSPDPQPSENFSGTYSTPAVYPDGGMLFIGVGGNNYHPVGPGIDHVTTPFLRAMRWDTLVDAWPLDDNNPPRYVNPYNDKTMYHTFGESGLSSPAVVNDVVFCSTTGVDLYALDARSGKLLWHDKLGRPTGGGGPPPDGTNGVGLGYGYCMGPAISGNFVVAGGLVAGGTGGSGGVLRIYSLPS